MKGTVFRKGIPPEERGYPGFSPGNKIVDGMAVDTDLAIIMRDGTRIYGDLWRAEGAGACPTLIAWAPYGKHGYLTPDLFPGCDINPEDVSRHFHFEAPDPAYWCAQGYAVLFVDPRGCWGSEGDYVTFFTDQEAQDLYDTIEWAAVQPWSTGAIGLSGQSYYAIVQWKVAAMRPPHLSCIVIWGGLSDLYRDFGRHGGLPETSFTGGFIQLAGVSRAMVEDMNASAAANAFADCSYWRERAPNIEAIEVPAYVVADWTDQSLHSRGNLEGYARLKGPKWLEINGKKKWERYYQPEHRDRLREFYDCFLKGQSDLLADWPPVRIEVREAGKQGQMRDEKAWPLARTSYRPLNLDLANKRLTKSAVTDPTCHESDARGGLLTLDFRAESDVEITGGAKLRLWVESDGSDDMDLFIGVQKLDANGDPVWFPHLTIFDDGLAAYGWLRVSHRELDPALSTPHRPWLKHERELRLSPGEVVPVEIEILPSSTLYRAGETLRLLIGGQDLVKRELRPGVIGHEDLRNHGRHRFYAGGKWDSHLLLPFIDA